MKVTASEIEGSQVVLDMEIESDRVDRAMERAYRRVSSRVNVPGFRRGKAPRAMVERLIGRETLMNEAIEILVPEAYDEAVRETGIDPVDQPKLEIVSAEPLSVKATVPVRPRVELGDYRSIRQTEEIPEITEEQVERTMESLRQSAGQWVPVEREARAGDLATVDLKGRVEDRVFVDNKGTQIILDPEHRIIAPGVVEQILGMKADERKAFDLTLPEDLSEKELAGKDAVLEVGVSELKEKQVPELDDELAGTLGDFADLQALRQAVRQELDEQARAQARQNLELSVLGAVIDQASAEPPTPWVEAQAEALRKNTQQGLDRQGLTLEQFLRFSHRTPESFQEELLTDARRQLKRTLVLDAVADVEGIEVSDEELNAALEQSIADRGGKVDAAERTQLRTNLRPLLRERKTVARLVALATGGQEAGPVEATATSESQIEEQA